MKKILFLPAIIVFQISMAQNIGIGTNTPTRPLSFPALLGKKISLYPGATGDAGFGVFGNELRIHSDYSGADLSFGYDDYALGFTERMRVRGNGDIGIGIVVPSGYGHGGNNRIMEINNPNTGSNIQSHLILSSNGTSGSTGGITWASQNVPGAEKRLGFIGNVYETSNAARIVFYTRNGAGILSEKFTINGAGNVGIGISNPSAMLDVAGNIKTIGSVTTNSLTIASGGQPSDFLIKNDVAGNVSFRKGHGDLGLNYIIALQGVFPSQGGPFLGGQTYIGEIKLFSGNNAPFGWALCNGQILPTTGNETLFAVIGTTYGGNGLTDFSLPDLRNRTPVGVGANWQLGEISN